MPFADPLSRLQSALADLPPLERRDAEQVLALGRARQGGTLVSDAETRRALGGLIERLGRRDGHAIPFASFARALSADLAGSASMRDESLGECDRALAMWGL